ncbi:MAG TPA: hypothetical protein VMG98_13395 [Verrucomicrobiae bacterium]|nr:hypothetical protein [Verrucomicrobiae bacterium]
MTFSWASFALGIIVPVLLWVAKEIFVPDLLDRRRQARANALEREAEARAQEREDRPVRERIGVAVVSLCDALYRGAYTRGEFTMDEWQHWHQQLATLIESAEGVRALGEHYRAFASALKHDALCMNIQGGREREWAEREAAGDERTRLRYEVRQHDAFFEQNATSVLFSWVEPLRAIDFAEQANRYEEAAILHTELAAAKLSELPPL